MTKHNFAAALLCAALASPTLAQDLGTPSGDVVLTVTGTIAKTNAESAARFDMEMLATLPATTFKTATIWTEGAHDFTGVSLKTLSDTLGMSGKTLKATAINDYAVEVPLADAVEGGPIVAYAMNGEPMSVRDKGPLWIIYPYDLNSDYQTEVIYSRSIWQLDRLEVME